MELEEGKGVKELCGSVRTLPLQYWWGWWRWGEGSSWPSPGTCCERPLEASTWRRTPGTSRSTPPSWHRQVGPLQPGTVSRPGRRGTAPAARGRSLPSLLPTCNNRRHTRDEMSHGISILHRVWWLQPKSQHNWSDLLREGNCCVYGYLLLFIILNVPPHTKSWHKNDTEADCCV